MSTECILLLHSVIKMKSYKSNHCTSRTICIMKGRRKCHPNICLFGKRIILGWIFLRKSRCLLCFSQLPPITASPQPTTSFLVFCWRCYLRWWLGLFQGVTLFSWVSPMYTKGIHVIKLCFSPLIWFYCKVVSAKNI